MERVPEGATGWLVDELVEDDDVDWTEEEDEEEEEDDVGPTELELELCEVTGCEEEEEDEEDELVVVEEVVVPWLLTA